MAASNSREVSAKLSLKDRLKFSADARKAGQDIDHIGDRARAQSRSFVGFAKGITRVGVAMGGMGAAVGVASVMLGTKFISAARESAKVSKQTEAVIRSTGGAARVTASHVGDLATAISNKTGVDDEAIQTGANMLLTFAKIRNGVGKNNKIFDRATQVITDMGAAMGKDPVAASVQLGKALNDPIKGVTALSKVGVTFDERQKKTIKRYVQMGKMARAQTVILNELAKEFGGSAAAQGDNIDKLKVNLGNLSEAIGGYLLPYANRFSGWVITTGLPALQRLAGVLLASVGPGGRFAGVVATIREKARGAFGYFQSDVLPQLKRFSSYLRSEIVPILGVFAGVWDNLRSSGTIAAIGRSINDIVSIIKQLAPALDNSEGPATSLLTQLGLMDDVTGFLASHVGLVRVAIVAYTGAQIAGAAATVARMGVERASIAVSKMQAAWTFVQTARQYGLSYALKAGGAAAKAYAAAQWLVNIAMSANPIGLVLVGLVALGAALVVAYKKSDTFRRIVNQAFAGVKAAGSAMWDRGLKPIFRFLVRTWISVAGRIIHGAARAFGWVPGLGPKLRAAAREFDKFAASVNRSLDGIKDKKVVVDVVVGSQRAALSPGGSVYGEQVPKILGRTGSASTGVPRHNARATGGYMSAGRSYLVGERGPELVRAHVNSSVLPQLPITSVPRFSGEAVGGDGAAAPLELHAHLYLDGVEVATNTGKHVARRQARKR